MIKLKGLLTESYKETVFTKELKKTIQKHFPKSFVDVYFGNSLIPSVTIHFAIGEKKDWSGGYVDNDPLHTKMLIYGFDGEGNPGVTLELEPLMSGLLVKPKNRMYAFSRVKIPTRKTKGDQKRIIKTVDTLFGRMKKITKDNLDNMSDGHKWVEKYI